MDKFDVVIVGSGGGSLITEAIRERMKLLDFEDLELRVLAHMSRGRNSKSAFLGTPFSQFPISDRIMGTQPSLMVFDELLSRVGADHPSRKREPKGPRGKWGKL